MRKNIIITGEPKSGKSTLLKNLIADIPNGVGFVTNEMLGENGRVGFEIETHARQKAILAHVDFETPNKVSKYFVNVNNLESILPSVSQPDNSHILYIDEIGQMQLFSEKFKELVLHYLGSPNTCIVTLSYIFENDFTQSLKNRKDIILVKISAENREERLVFITQILKKIEKAKKYVSEPERFKIEENNVELRSEHGTRYLTLVGKDLNCTCDFSNSMGYAVT